MLQKQVSGFPFVMPEEAGIQEVIMDSGQTPAG
jgi:hypothetical protein